jgi:hypothetical protein
VAGVTKVALAILEGVIPCLAAAEAALVTQATAAGTMGAFLFSEAAEAAEAAKAIRLTGAFPSLPERAEQAVPITIREQRAGIRLAAAEDRKLTRVETARMVW